MVSEQLKSQIEAAFDFRGHVTVRLANGQSVEGFLYNRQYELPNSAESHFVELYLKGTAEPRRLAMSEIESIALTGEDFAAGKSYDDYLKKKAAEKKE